MKLVRALLIIALLFSTVTPTLAGYTIDQRQVALQARVNKGQKSKELTKAEADKLREMLSDIAKDIAKMKAKNGGKLSYKDEGKIEKALNKVSLRIDKLKLEKRTQAK